MKSALGDNIRKSPAETDCWGFANVIAKSRLQNTLIFSYLILWFSCFFALSNLFIFLIKFIESNWSTSTTILHIRLNLRHSSFLTFRFFVFVFVLNFHFNCLLSFRSLLLFIMISIIVSIIVFIIVFILILILILIIKMNFSIIFSAGLFIYKHFIWFRSYCFFFIIFTQGWFFFWSLYDNLVIYINWQSLLLLSCLSWLYWLILCYQRSFTSFSGVSTYPLSEWKCIRV